MTRLSQRVAQLHASPIREILAVIEQPGMVSFAGGLPAPETFMMQLLQNPQQEQRLARLASVYLQNCDRFSSLLDLYFSAIADWEQPSGGLFFWVKLKTRIDTSLLLKRAIAEQVAFMPGEYFFPDVTSSGSDTSANAGSNTGANKVPNTVPSTLPSALQNSAQVPDSFLRLNSSHASADHAEKGLAKLAAIIRDFPQGR